MTLRKALLAATVLALPVAAQAQPVSGLYVGAGAGLNYHQESTDSGLKLKYKDVGAVGLGALGWGFGNGLRAELEGNYRSNDLRRSTIGGVRASDTAGSVLNYGVMVNAVYDIQTGSPITPYLGVGAGYGWVESHKIRATTGALTTTSTDTAGNFAYQGIAGVGYNLGAGLTLTAEYRFYGTLDPKLDAEVRSGAANGRVLASGKIEPTNYNHSVLLGVRYAFNAPAAAPAAPVVAPVAPPAAARTYLVFFDWDRADLTDRARQIIAEAAQNAKRTQTTRIEVAGHADRSGTPQYNQRLSQRRADTVAAELVRQGIARNEIAVTAYGESRPLVPTADGVREPQNRRVEIVLR
ncbi:OmpA family protein [Paracraurococcus lichenis]|uniref:OmpA family protein n=1 Tax=Paracraurococcus lichenis TaxID=3064888 RepID=A0ABT9E4Q5_9PROT|nr:OmpA family protein [Paracraurococcus sp. LOR1-02]MDO9711160.1 OmpA family protein [Paracraurococcus sp. LOR1-02]